jgi:cytidyltransferase-like protein
LRDNTVGICFGAFDPLHIGHIFLFQRAKQQCDVLIVAVATLGAAREGKLIDSDYDIDLCVILPCRGHRETRNQTYLIELIKKGWLKRIFDKDQNYLDNPRQAKNILGQAHIHIAGCVIDLFVAWQKDGKYYTCQWGEIGKANGHTVLQLEDQIFKAPSDYDNILTTLYGDWRTPSDDHPSKRLIRKCYFE